MARRIVIERPILFSGPMVRALFAGRKTQTRRVLRDQQPIDLGAGMHGAHLSRRPVHDHGKHVGHRMAPVVCPYGVPGDRLWVRETWREDRQAHEEPDREGELYGYLHRADPDEKDSKRHPWRPSIFMPRIACRLVLEVTDVRVERLQDISEADAIAEGIERNCDGLAAHPTCPPCRAAGKCQAEGEYIDYSEGEDGVPAQNARDSYRSLWDSLNATRGFGWAENPLVWVVTFKRAS